jgi:hypothetical protein
MIVDTLKPCPFCGGRPNLWTWNYGACVECENYHVDKHRVAFMGKTEDEAIALWETRREDAK